MWVSPRFPRDAVLYPVFPFVEIMPPLFRTVLSVAVLIVSTWAITRSSTGSEIEFEPDIEFARPAPETSLKLNLARPAQGAGPFPAVVCIHGGGFTGGTRDQWDSFARRLAGEGYVAVTIDYRLSPRSRWPAHIHDCKAAVRWLRASAAKYRIDPDRIGAMGNSAGGHLAQFLAVTNDVREFDGDHTELDQSSRVTCVAAWGQASDFTREYGIWKQAPEAFKAFLGEELTVDSRRLHIQASPLFWATPNAAPSLIIHGTEDKDVLFAQSVWMYERLKSAEVETELVPIVGGGHGLAGEHLKQAEEATLKFFRRYLQKHKPQAATSR